MENLHAINGKFNYKSPFSIANCNKLPGRVSFDSPHPHLVVHPPVGVRILGRQSIPIPQKKSNDDRKHSSKTPLMNHQPSNNIKHLNKKKQKLYHSTAENIQKHRKFNGRKQLKLSRATDAFLHPFPFFHQRAIRQAPQHLRRQRRPFAHHKAALGAAHDAKNGPWLELKQVLDVLRRHRQMLSAENAEFLIKTVDI